MRLINRSIIVSLIAGAIGVTVTSSLVGQNAKQTVPHYAGPREDVPVPRPGMTPQKAGQICSGSSRNGGCTKMYVSNAG